jgi:hypothetical protein
MLPISLGAKDPGEGSPTVRDLQTRLINKGFACGQYGADGDFGDATLLAVRRYQTRIGLEVDGVVGVLTWAKLISNSTGGPGSAARMADSALQLVTSGVDGSKPRYVFGAEVRLTDPSPDRLDCSELVQWAVHQATGRDWVDGSRAQYAAGTRVSIARAIATKGALLFLSNGSPLGIHHVAISLGNGKTAEARSASLGCGSWPAAGRGWKYACTIPALRYS